MNVEGKTAVASGSLRATVGLCVNLRASADGGDGCGFRVAGSGEAARTGLHRCASVFIGGSALALVPPRTLRLCGEWDEKMVLGVGW